MRFFVAGKKKVLFLQRELIEKNNNLNTITNKQKSNVKI